MSTDCPQAHELLDPEGEFRAHLESCAACRERRETLTRLLDVTPTAEPPAHVLPELLRRIDEQVAREVRSLPFPEGSMSREEPVAYLGGAVLESAPPDAPIEAYLGGDVPADSLPALPPAGVSAVYSASDFLAAPPEEPEAAVLTENTFESYAEPEPEPAHEPGLAGSDTVTEAAAAPELDLPETISQKDAEDIIQRITTRQVLPELAAPEKLAPVELTRRRRPLRALAAALVLVVAGAAAAVYFKDDVGPYLPEALQSFMGYVPPPSPVVIDSPVADPPEMTKQRAFRKKILESEWRAFGYSSEREMLASNLPATLPAAEHGDNGGKK